MLPKFANVYIVTKNSISQLGLTAGHERPSSLTEVLKFSHINLSSENEAIKSPGRDSETK